MGYSHRLAKSWTLDDITHFHFFFHSQAWGDRGGTTLKVNIVAEFVEAGDGLGVSSE